MHTFALHSNTYTYPWNRRISNFNDQQSQVKSIGVLWVTDDKMFHTVYIPRKGKSSVAAFTVLRTCSHFVYTNIVKARPLIAQRRHFP